LDIFCIPFLDDIHIDSDDQKEHKALVQVVRESLKEAGFYLKTEKCEFHKEEVNYLGLIVRVNEIRMDPEKVPAVENWEAPVALNKV
jgi:hypothetical protein